jgi:hypothetical protein
VLQTITLIVVTSCIVASFGWWQRSRYLALAQPASFYDLRPDGSTSAITTGAVTWALAGDEESSSTRLVAHVVVPGRLDITLSFLKNLDNSLPASLLIEIVQNDSSTSTESQIADVSVPSVKDTENSIGKPLNAVTAKIDNGDFWIALSPVVQDIVANLGLLRRAQEIILPLTFASRERGLLILSKGPPGEVLLRSALLAWAQDGLGRGIRRFEP